MQYHRQYLLYILFYIAMQTSPFNCYTQLVSNSKNYKSLQSYKYFTAGWIVEHKWKLFTDYCLVVGRVNHGYTLKQWSCCMWPLSRLGETCLHVGVLLYYVEYQVCRYAETSSTSKSNTWLEPCTTKQAPCLRLEDTSFTSAE